VGFSATSGGEQAQAILEGAEAIHNCSSSRSQVCGTGVRAILICSQRQNTKGPGKIRVGDKHRVT